MTFVTGLVRPYAGTGVQAGPIRDDKPMLGRVVMAPPPPASTPEPKYGRTNPVTNVTGLARQNQTILLSGSNFDLSFDFQTFNSIMAADADATAAARALAEARRQAKSTKLDMDVKAMLVTAMSHPTGFEGYMTQIFVS